MKIVGAEPKEPPTSGGMWVACMLDEHGDEWPTGRVWSSREDALRDGVDTAAEWSARRQRRRWWQFWKRRNS